jgi:hypothetical protein
LEKKRPPYQAVPVIETAAARMDTHSADRRGPFIVFALTLISYAYFYQGGGPNQFSRFGLTASLSKQGRVNIDAYQELTFDKAYKDGHYYCDKAPGLSLLAAPEYAACLPLIEHWTEAGSWPWVNLSLYTVTILAVSLPVAVAMALFYQRARTEAGPALAFWVTIALALGSPLTVYASLFYSHALCAALLWIAFVLLTPELQSERLALWRPGVAGFLAGWATLSEFPTVLITGLLFLSLCLTARSWRAALAFVAGSLPTLGLLIAYNLAAFGRPLVSGYQYHMVEEFREQMSQGVMGITGPSLGSLAGVLLLPYRGLLWFWPFFYCVLGAGLLLIARRRLCGPTLLASVIVVVYLLFACSYYLWSGGASYGPRHVIPCLPFAAYLVVRTGPSLLQGLIPVASLLSVGVTLASIATLAEFPEPDPTALPVLSASTVGLLGNPSEQGALGAAAAVFPERADVAQTWANPLLRIALPRFLRGELSVKTIGRQGLIQWSAKPLSVDDPHFYDAWNAGELLGLRGLSSLLPLFVVWTALGVCLWRNGRERSQASADVQGKKPAAS